MTLYPSDIQVVKYPTSALDNQVETMAKIGSWTFNVEHKEIKWSLNTFNLHGFDQSATFSLSNILEIYTASSQEAFMNALEKCLDNQSPSSFEVEIDQNSAPLSSPTLTCMMQPSLSEEKISGVVGIFQIEPTNASQTELLKDSERKFKAVFNQAFQFVGLLDRDGIVLEANETSLEFGGFALNEVINKPFWQMPWFDKKDIQIDQIQRALESAAKGRLIRFETELTGIGGSSITVDLSIRPILDDQGKVMYLIPEGRDISDKREVHQQLINLNQELEKKVDERTEELKEINQDLESFAYSISHDLRAPLRAINGFSQILSEEYEEVMDNEAKRLLDIIFDNSEKMSHLIDDLLLFSRTSRELVQKSKVNMNTIFHNASNELKKDEAYLHTQVQIDVLPDVMADYNMMNQVVVNLLGNSFKYSSTKPSPEIKVKSTIKDSFIEFSITDNGVGFKAEHANNLFQVFQRLHSAKEFEGTGVGLSIVRKIVEKHGGNVWAEGQLNEGATFYFTLPIDE